MEEATRRGGEFGERRDVGGAGADFVAGGVEDRPARAGRRRRSGRAGLDLDAVGLEARREQHALPGRQAVEAGAGALQRRLEPAVAAQDDEAGRKVAAETAVLLDHAECRFEQPVTAVEIQLPLGAGAPVGGVADHLGDEPAQVRPA